MLGSTGELVGNDTLTPEVETPAGHEASFFSRSSAFNALTKTDLVPIVNCVPSSRAKAGTQRLPEPEQSLVGVLSLVFTH
jgi:hypothetical protein